MAKTLVTGATGFVGTQLARELAQRGDQLKLGIRESSHTAGIEGLGAELVDCEVLDPDAIRRALRGVDKVFHVAAVNSMRVADAHRLFDVNVTGTRNVVEACLERGVERVIHTSSAASVGPAPRGATADERQLYVAGRLGIPYVEAMHRAEAEALRAAARGLAVTCVNPTLVLGPGDVRATTTRIVRSFLIGRVPAYADGAICVVDARDVAKGQLLADEHGGTGERYILGGRNYTFDRLFADLSRISGLEAPVKVPQPLAVAAAQLAPMARMPATLTRREVLAGSQYWTYSSAKARRELGFTARPHEETLQETVDWYMEHEGERIARERRSQQLHYRLAGALIGTAEDGVALGRRVLGGLGRPRR